MPTNIYQAHSKRNGHIETVILCDACYKRWHPAGAIKLVAETHENTPCEMCDPDLFGVHLEDMRRKLDDG